MYILEMKKISKSFSGVYANENIDIRVKRGEIHALLGENGAGKTTLMNILFGIYKADSGKIIYNGEEMKFDTPKDAIKMDIGMVHQHFSVVKRLTVLDNIILGLKSNGIILDRKTAREKVVALSKKYALEVNPDMLIEKLSVGQQQRVEILKALYKEAKLLILDEPTGVLTPQETEHFFDILRKLKKEGHSIIIITHRMSEIMSISDSITVLRDGKKIIDLETKNTNPGELSKHMIGRDISNEFEVRDLGKKEDALVLKDILVKKHNKKAEIDGISLNVKKGEILGIVGVEGNGQRQLAEVITGIIKPNKGSVTFDGSDITKKNVRNRFERGISYISDDRHRDGLILEMTVEDNLILREYGYKNYSKNMILNKKSVVQNAIEKIKDFKIKTSGTTAGKTQVKLMSGGNQQKVILAREISVDAKLIVASQPTRGLDMGASSFVREKLMEQRNNGKSVILFSADLEEVFALSDRIAVLYSGKIMDVIERADADLEQIGMLMGGIREKEMV